MISEALKLKLEQYILDNYDPPMDEGGENGGFDFGRPHPSGAPSPRRIKPLLISASRLKSETPVFEETELTFQETLFKYIDEKGLTDVEVYNSAFIDRKHFSKIRSNKDYAPRKSTVIKFCLALSLNIEKSKDLLEKAGFALSKSILTDVIVEFCIRNRMYNIIDVNTLLFDNNCPIL